MSVVFWCKVGMGFCALLGLVSAVVYWIERRRPHGMGVLPCLARAVLFSGAGAFLFALAALIAGKE